MQRTTKKHENIEFLPQTIASMTRTINIPEKKPTRKVVHAFCCHKKNILYLTILLITLMTKTTTIINTVLSPNEFVISKMIRCYPP